MAQALLDGMLHAGVADAGRLYAADPSAERREVFALRIAGNSLSNNTELAHTCDVVVLAVKPNVVPVAAGQIVRAITPAKLIVSIAAGVKLSALAGMLHTDRLIRVMPNTPALIGAGASAYCRGAGATDEDAAVVDEMLGAVGTCVQVDEKLMDAVTGLSGSGPAYVYMMIEALSDGGVKMGLPRPVAARLAAQTVAGAARMVLETGKHPGELKDQVTTPGGTTIEGLHALEKAGVRQAFINAVEAATKKSRALAGGS
jgi:pyrroline-5-carboxylate reductase